MFQRFLKYIKKSLDLKDPIQVKILAFYEYFEEFYIGKKIKERIGRENVQKFNLRIFFKVYH